MTRRGRTTAALAALALALVRAAGAQARSSLEAGAGVVGTGLVSSPAAVVQGWTAWSAGAAELGLAGRMVGFDDGARETWGAVHARLRTPVRGGLRLDARGLAERAAPRGYDAASRVEVRAGPAFERGPWSAHALLGASRLSRDGTGAAVLGEATVGRRTSAGAVSLTARSVSFTRRELVNRDTTYVILGFPFHGRTAAVEDRTRAYVDLEGAAALAAGPLLLEGLGGVRRALSNTQSERWGEVRAVLPLAAGTGLVVSVGRRSRTPEQELPGGRFATLGIRVSRGGAPRFAPLPPSPDEPRVEVLAAEGGRRLLRVRNLPASAVEVMGDFSDWMPVALQDAGEGRWEASLPLRAGSHRVMVRVDGGEWMPPPGLPAAPDEFGGRVGVLLVEG